MKRLLLIALIFVAGTVWAQDVVRDSVPPAVADTADDGENVIGGRVQLSNPQKEPNVIGMPVYYNRDGSKRSATYRGNPRGAYQMPRHHYQNTLDRQFCSVFFECEGMLNADDLAAGFNVSYLPNRWGAYCSLLGGINYRYVSAGPVLRLSDVDNSLDWQLYGGLMYSAGFGGEVGVRIASAKNQSEFCMTSFSMGVGCVGGDPFFTMGLSVDLMAISGLSLLLLLL